jgi:hypothetical protein
VPGLPAGRAVTAKGGQHAWRQREREAQRRAKLAAKQAKRDHSRTQRQDRQRPTEAP